MNVAQFCFVLAVISIAPSAAFDVTEGAFRTLRGGSESLGANVRGSSWFDEPTEEKPEEPRAPEPAAPKDMPKETPKAVAQAPPVQAEPMKTKVEPAVQAEPMKTKVEPALVKIPVLAGVDASAEIAEEVGEEPHHTVEGHEEDHEHGGSPGDGAHNMVPRTMVHGHDDAPHKEEARHVEHPHAWSYGAPVNWTKPFPLCSGDAQSPIDIPVAEVATGSGTDTIAHHMKYHAMGDRQIHNNGHNEQVNGDFGELYLPDGTYEVKQFDFHFPSEHSVNGKLAAGEIHIVHQRKGSNGTDDLAVVAILLQEEKDLGDHFSAKDRGVELNFLRQLGYGARVPGKDEKQDIDGKVDLNAFSKEFSGPFYHYKGSLTTPPCSQTVHWYILQRPAAVQADMIETFKANFPSPANNRPVQTLNGRKIVYSEVSLDAAEFREKAAKSSSCRIGGLIGLLLPFALLW